MNATSGLYRRNTVSLWSPGSFTVQYRKEDAYTNIEDVSVNATHVHVHHMPRLLAYVTTCISLMLDKKRDENFT